MSDSILCLVATSDASALDRHSLEVLESARLLSAATGHALVVGCISNTLPDLSVGSCSAARYLAVVDSALSQARYASDASAAEALVRASGATLILAPANSRFQRIMPGVARRCGGKVDTHATAMDFSEGKLTVSRWYYRQRMLARLTRIVRPWFVTVESGCYASLTLGDSVAWETVSVPGLSSRTRVLGVESSSAGDQTIRPDAEVLFVAGAGWTKKQADGNTQIQRADKLILDFVRKGQASLGSSKSMVDLSSEGQEVLPFLTHMHQVGQTGSTPRHAKGLATCCHGEEPHAVGWRFIQERRAINLDANCGWAHGKADVLYVADAFEVMEKVNARL
jgi:electron transfer flavoprotein alpha subunit